MIKNIIFYFFLFCPFTEALSQNFIDRASAKTVIRVHGLVYKKLPALISGIDTLKGYWAFHKDTIFFLNQKAIQEKCWKKIPIFILNEETSYLEENDDIKENCAYLHEREYDQLESPHRAYSERLNMLITKNDIIYTFRHTSEDMLYHAMSHHGLDPDKLPVRIFQFSMSKGFLKFESKNIHEKDSGTSTCFTY